MEVYVNMKVMTDYDKPTLPKKKNLTNWRQGSADNTRIVLSNASLCYQGRMLHKYGIYAT